ncbi:unnamed protein product [Eruca vesicaria subsp. sativa]|uniref:Uncharacterized protein n=1 Tax=Eruca vesicaria subsp. sativa TaxID=29727 RepID=A0ABC8LKX9_ERUVS|nr:unnamed protein product [Eruca vesicaria subsp. sativa]
MANVSVFLSDLLTGRSTSTVQVCLGGQERLPWWRSHGSGYGPPRLSGKREPNDALDTKVNIKEEERRYCCCSKKKKDEYKCPRRWRPLTHQIPYIMIFRKAKKVPFKKVPVKAASSSDG